MASAKVFHCSAPAAGAWAGRLRGAAAALTLALVAAAGPSSAERTWQQEIGTFRVGMLGEPGAGASLPRLAELKKAYTLALGVPVEFFVAEDYRTLIEAQSEGRIDYAVYSAAAYATAALACDCVTPLVAPTATSGAIGVRSALIARQGGLATLADMPGHRVAIAGEEDVAGHQLPLMSLRKEGVTLTGDEPFLVHAASAGQAEAMLAAGEVDAMFGWIETGIGKTPVPGSGTLENLAAATGASGAFEIVWASDLLRYGPHAVGSDLDPEIRRRLVPFLTGLRDTDPDLFQALARHQLGGFVSVNDEDYATAREMVRAAAGMPD